METYQRIKFMIDELIKPSTTKVDYDDFVEWTFDKDIKHNKSILMYVSYGKNRSKEFYDVFGSNYKELITGSTLSATIFICPAGLEIHLTELDLEPGQISREQLIVSDTLAGKKIADLLFRYSPILIHFFEDVGWPLSS